MTGVGGAQVENRKFDEMFVRGVGKSAFCGHQQDMTRFVAAPGEDTKLADNFCCGLRLNCFPLANEAYPELMGRRLRTEN